MTPSKILITGATGFIGSRFCERLSLEYRRPYRALVRNFARAPRIARLGAEMAAGALDDVAAIERAMEGCDTVVHLAYSEPAHTRNLLRVCQKRGIKRLVHMSSIAVHGPRPGAECAREETATIGRYPGEGYSNAKAEAELSVQKAIREGLPAVILRPTIVYGPYGPFVTSIVNAARDTGVLTLLDEGRGVCNAVYVDDVCSAILAAIESDAGVGAAFFVTGDRASSWREFNLAFAGMVDPAPRIASLSGEEVRQYWASQKPTLKSNVAAIGRLALSPDFHRQLGSVPMFGALITRGKDTAKHLLSPERVAALKQMRGSSSNGRRGTAPAIPWPDSGRVTRECLGIEFSNVRARDVLGWRPQYDLQAGAAVTRSWLQFAGLIAK